MPTSLMPGPRAVFVDYAPDQPLNGFHSKQSAAAFEQGLLTRDEAMRAEWVSAGRQAKQPSTWRKL